MANRSRGAHCCGPVRSNNSRAKAEIGQSSARASGQPKSALRSVGVRGSVWKLTSLALLSVLLFSVTITAFAQAPDPNTPPDAADDKPAAAAANNADALRKA